MKRLLLLSAFGLALAACHDTRREAVRDYLQEHPPEGYEIAAAPDAITFVTSADGSSEAVVAMKYRLTAPTVEIRDLSTLPRGVELGRRISEVRGWALSALPAGDSTRERITTLSAEARKPFPTKRAVTPAGTEIETTVSVALRKDSGKWLASAQPTISVAGDHDTHADVPWEDSPEVSKKLAELETTASTLEETKRKYLADRQRVWEQSLARLRAALKTGRIFEGVLPDGAGVQLVVSQGTDAGETITGVLSVQREAQSSARYTGAIAPLSSGEAAWRATQISPLSTAAGEPLTDAASHPTLLLAAREKGIAAAVTPLGRKPIPFVLKPAGEADLIPDVPSQSVNSE